MKILLQKNFLNFLSNFKLIIIRNFVNENEIHLYHMFTKYLILSLNNVKIIQKKIRIKII